MKQCKLKTILILCLSAGLVFMSTQSSAQGTDTTDFEDATKGNYTLATVLVNGKNWEFSGVMIGADIAKDIKTGLKAARFRYVDSIPTSITLLDTMTEISSISFQYARSDFSGDRTGVSSKFVIQVSNGSAWTTLDTIDLAGVDELTTATYSSIPAGNDFVRFVAISGVLGKRFNIDNIIIASGGDASSAITLEDKLPFGPDVPLTMTQLTGKYSTDIQKGTGNIHLYKSTGELVASIDVTDAGVTIADSTATIGSFILASATSYYVLMDAGVFAKNGEATTTSTAIAAPTVWTFTTIDTTTMPFMTSLEESFVDCSDAGMGVFRQYSVKGDKKWYCSRISHTSDSAAASINGGAAVGVSEINEDWLISVAKFDLGAFARPNLSFWNQKTFDGTVISKVKISTDYTGMGDPNAATWIDIYTIAAPAGSNVWSQVTGINLTAYKSTPFFLAFTYECATTGAYGYTLDDIKVVNNTSSINNTSDYNKDFLVLGNPTGTIINLRFSTAKAGIYTAEVIDMNGRTITSQNFNISNGINDFAIQNINLPAGMYLIKMTDDQAGIMSTVKAMVQ